MAIPLTCLLRSNNPDVTAQIQACLADSPLLHRLHSLRDDTELLAYLRHQDQYSDPRCAPRPDLLLLDLDSLDENATALLAALGSVPTLKGRAIVLMSRSDPERLLGPSLPLETYAFLRPPLTYQALFRLLSTRES